MGIKVLTILLFVCSCCNGQWFPSLKNGAHTANVITVKRIQIVSDSPIYEAFQVLVQNKYNEVSLYYNRSKTHTTLGNLYRRVFNIAATQMGSPILVWADSLALSGVSGGKMDNDSTVLFVVRNHTDATRDIYILKCDSNNHFSAPVLFNWTGIENLGAGFNFGGLIAGDAPGESYQLLYQVAAGRFKVTILKTTDYWNHYTEVGTLWDGVTAYTEPAGANLGGGKFVALCRNNIAGSLTPFESTDYGVTWIRRAMSNLYWNNGGGPEIPWVDTHDGVFDIMYECRDASMIQISKGNTVASNFGLTTPIYNDPEIYSYHRGTGGNPSLGYVSKLKLNTGKYFIVYSKEYNNNKANLQWTVDDLTTDPNGIPPAPSTVTSGITSSAFRIDSPNYQDTIAVQNIRYGVMDLSTHADFSDFVTAKYRNVGAYPAIPIHDVRVTGYFIPFTSLTTGTTYYFRIKSCNNVGCSAYTTTSVTTL